MVELMPEIVYEMVSRMLLRDLVCGILAHP